jgi:hypothetical protein
MADTAGGTTAAAPPRRDRTHWLYIAVSAASPSDTSW